MFEARHAKGANKAALTKNPDAVFTACEPLYQACFACYHACRFCSCQEAPPKGQSESH